jgi:hypothetical protein
MSVFGFSRPPPHAAARTPFDDEAVFSFCALYAHLTAPRARTASGVVTADADAIVGRLHVLNALVFTPGLQLAPRLWAFLVERCNLQELVRHEAFKSTWALTDTQAVLTLFVTIISHLMMVVDDFELYGYGGGSGRGSGSNNDVPLLPPLRELRHAVRLVRDILAHAEGVGVDAYKDSTAPKLLSAPASLAWPRFAAAGIQMLRFMYDRHSQRPLGPPDMWIVDVTKTQHCIVSTDAATGAVGVSSSAEDAVRRLMPALPFTVPFERRAELYDRQREAERQLHQTARPQVRITVQRARLFETAHAALANVRGDDLKRKVYVQVCIVLIVIHNVGYFC